MDADTQNALIGLWGVLIGAVVSLVASVIVPWVRDVLDRKRIAREARTTERREWLLNTIAALLELRQAQSRDSNNPSGDALAKFGNAHNQLAVRLTQAEQPVLDVIQAMHAMVRERGSNIEDIMAEAMTVLTLWARDDVPTDRIVPEFESRAGIMFSVDRKTFGVVAKKQP